jgi:hypothetical protein
VDTSLEFAPAIEYLEGIVLEWASWDRFTYEEPYYERELRRFLGEA